LGSDGSSNKTPGSGFEFKSKSFTTLIEEGHEEALEAVENTEEVGDLAPEVMKRSISSTVDDDEEEDLNGQNNNNEYTQESSDDNLLESLDRKVCMLWEKKNSTGRGRAACLRSTTCCYHYPCSHCRGLGHRAMGQQDHLTEEEEEPRQEGMQFPLNSGRTESNETLESRENETSSREDLFGDAFGTLSDEEETTGRHDSNYFVIQRRSLMRKPIQRRRSRLATHPFAESDACSLSRSTSLDPDSRHGPTQV